MVTTEDVAEDYGAEQIDESGDTVTFRAGNVDKTKVIMLVDAMSKHGYRVFGVDFEETTITFGSR